MFTHSRLSCFTRLSTTAAIPIILLWEPCPFFMKHCREEIYYDLQEVPIISMNDAFTTSVLCMKYHAGIRLFMVALYTVKNTCWFVWIFLCYLDTSLKLLWKLGLACFSRQSIRVCQGSGPRGYVKTAFISIFRNWPSNAIFLNKARSICKRSRRSSAKTFVTALNDLSFIFLRGSKKPLDGFDKRRLVTKFLIASLLFVWLLTSPPGHQDCNSCWQVDQIFSVRPRDSDHIC